MSIVINARGEHVYDANEYMLFRSSGSVLYWNLSLSSPGDMQQQLDEGYVLVSLEGQALHSENLMRDLPFYSNLPRTLHVKWMKYLPRVSKDNPSQVAFYESEEKRRAGRLTRTKPGRFLRRCFTKDELSDQGVEELANEWIATYSPQDIHVLTCPDEIEAAYTERRFGSCMGYARSHYSSSEHPVRVYGSTDAVKSDLAVAVIYDAGAEQGDFENIAARCIVWPDKKIYGRLYGDVGKMKFQLETAGYSEGNFTGARIRYIKDGPGPAVCPYIDVADSVSIDGDHLVLDGGDFSCNNTNGLMGEVCFCSDCSDEVDPDEARTSDYGEVYCEDCYNERWRYCDVLNVTVDADEFSSDVRGELPRPWGGYSDASSLSISDSGVERLIEQGRVFFCELSNAHFTTYSFECVTDENGETYESEAFYNNGGYFCEFLEEFYLDGGLDVGGATVNAVEAAYCEEAYVKWLRDNGYTDDRFPEEDEQDTEQEDAA